ncbi:MAG: ribosomal protein [Bacteroidota bacterium]|jgi:large subunit ribosomal protein L21
MFESEILNHVLPKLYFGFEKIDECFIKKELTKVCLYKKSNYFCGQYSKKEMNAIVKILGQQFRVEAGKEVSIHRLEGNVGDVVNFSDVMLLDNNGKITVGMPLVKDSKVTAKILEHMQGEKVAVFKKKRRKGYQKYNNHRQQYTKIMIESIA